MLETKDHIKRIRTYKPGKPIEEVIRELNLKGEVIKLASNENPLGTSPLALEAMQKALTEVYFYPDDNCFHHALRITISTESHNRRLIRTLEKML